MQNRSEMSGRSRAETGVCPAGGYAAAILNDGTVASVITSPGWSGAVENVVDLDCSGWAIIAPREDGTCVVNGVDSY